MLRSVWNKKKVKWLRRPTHLAITPQIDEPNEVRQRSYPIGHVVDLRSFERSCSGVPMRTRVGGFPGFGRLFTFHAGFPFISLMYI